MLLDFLKFNKVNELLGIFLLIGRDLYRLSDLF